MAEFKSNTVSLTGSADVVYAKLSNPEALGALLKSMREQGEQKGMSMPDDVARNLEKITLSGDSISIQGGPTGALTLVRDKTECPTLVSYAGQNTPVPISIAFSITPAGATSTLQVSIEAQVPIILKGMIAKPMQQAVDMFATLMQNIPVWE